MFILTNRTRLTTVKKIKCNMYKQLKQKITSDICKCSYDITLVFLSEVSHFLGLKYINVC
jgi:hypothetical protein